MRERGTTSRVLTAGRARRGFTLIELLTVVAIIGLLLGITLPTISTMFRSGPEAQARNVLDAQLGLARSIAMRDQQFTCLHVQKHWDGTKDEWWVGVFKGRLEAHPADPSQMVVRFYLVDGTDMARLPEGMAAGEVSDRFISGGNYDETKLTTGALVDDFTSFSVLFDPGGRLTPDVNGEKIWFADAAPFFPQGTTFPRPPPIPRDKVWKWEVANPPLNPPDPRTKYGENGVRAICTYDDVQFGARSLNDAVKFYLNENARFLAVNPYLGGLIKSPAE